MVHFDGPRIVGRVDGTTGSGGQFDDRRRKLCGKDFIRLNRWITCQAEKYLMTVIRKKSIVQIDLIRRKEAI